MPKLIVGQRCGQLIALQKCEPLRKHDGKRNRNRIQWLFRCDCGREKIIVADRVTTGHAKSCGCLKRGREIIHGATSSKYIGTPLAKTYAIWCAAKARCFLPTNSRYSTYGARGITMCDRWANSFEHFLQDMGQCPKGMSIERVNNDGNYEPDNCVWIPRSEQGKNKTNNIWVVFGKQRMTLTDYARSRGLNFKALYYRMRKYGQTGQEAAADLLSRM